MAALIFVDVKVSPIWTRIENRPLCKSTCCDYTDDVFRFCRTLL